MKRRSVGQLYIDYTPNYSSVVAIPEPKRVKPEIVPVEPVIPSPIVDPSIPPEAAPIQPITPPEGGLLPTPISGDNPPPVLPPNETPPQIIPPQVPPYNPHTEPDMHAERRFYEAHDNGDYDIMAPATSAFITSWSQQYAKTLRVSLEERILGPVSEVVMDDLSMHKYAKFSETAYQHFNEGGNVRPDVVDLYLQDPAHSYISDLKNFKVDRELSTADNVVLVSDNEVVIAYRGTAVPEDWPTNFKVLTNREQMSQRWADADEQFLKVSSRYGKGKIKVTGHSQGGGVSSYVAERYNVEGFHYQPAMSFAQRMRIVGEKMGFPDWMKNYPLKKLDEVNKSAQGYGKVGQMDSLSTGAPKPTLAAEVADGISALKPNADGSVPVAQRVGRAPVNEGDFLFTENKWRVVDHETFWTGEPPAQQVIYRTHGDLVSGFTTNGLEEANPNWKIKTVNTIETHAEDLTKIHSTSNFHPPPATSAEMERGALLMGENGVAVTRLTSSSAVKGALKGGLKVAGYGAVAASTGWDIYNDTRHGTATQKGVTTSIGITKNLGSLVGGEMAGTAAADALLAAGILGPETMGLSVVAVLAGMAAGIAITYVGDYLEHHWEEVESKMENAAKTVGKGFVTAGKTVYSGLKTADKAVEKFTSKASSKVRHFFHI